jgi:hypothetical protein
MPQLSLKTDFLQAGVFFHCENFLNTKDTKATKEIQGSLIVKFVTPIPAFPQIKERIWGKGNRCLDANDIS